MTNALDFPDIPPDRIAQHPRPARDMARLMVVSRSDNGLKDVWFRDIHEYLQRGDALVLNNVRVFPARLIGQKKTGGRVAVLLLARFAAENRWTALVTPRPMIGWEIVFPDGVSARVSGETPEGEWELDFSGSVQSLIDAGRGSMPLPPYIKRPAGAHPADEAGYQTVYADVLEADGAGPGPVPPGAVAAPTAGLHFTQDLLDTLRAKGVRVEALTLWVGWGTFRPIAADIGAHRMLAELYRIPMAVTAAVRSARGEGRRVWAVGTTVVRALESAVDDHGRPRPGTGRATLFITPGHRFRCVDALITNFHLPRHTPLYLAAAFAGSDRLRHAYRHALESGYQFLSYGDAMAIL